MTRTVLHLPCSYLPWTTGGKEIYAHSLACELRQSGWVNHTAFHQNSNTSEPLGTHALDGVQIHVLPALSGIDRSAVYDCRTPGVPGFAELLERVRPDIVHFHDFSISANLLHLELAKKSGAKTVMSYHTPGQSCLQRELRYNGQTICDGEIRLGRCTACRLGAQGISAPVRWLLAQSPLPEAGSSPLGRALSARAMTRRFVQAWRHAVRNFDHLHAPAQWAADLLRVNGVPQEKLSFIRTGLPFPREPVISRQPRNVDQPLRVVMPGRCEPIKGQAILIDAVKGLSAEVKIKASFLGPYWGTTTYGRQCLEKIRGDDRFDPPVLITPGEMPARLAQADVAVIPSLWLETGPLVVLEAMAAGLPVVGSHLGGIAELVRDGVDGLLFEPGNAEALRHHLERLATQPALLDSLRNKLLPPRTMREVACDTAQLYDRLLETA